MAEAAKRLVIVYVDGPNWKAAQLDAGFYWGSESIDLEALGEKLSTAPSEADLDTLHGPYGTAAEAEADIDGPEFVIVRRDVAA